jgi:hypothetical protein
MSLQVRRSTTVFDRVGRVPRPVAREVANAGYRGAVAAATVRAAGQVTHVALTLTATLTAEEARLIAMCPLGEARFRAIVDSFTNVATAEIARLMW